MVPGAFRAKGLKTKAQILAMKGQTAFKDISNSEMADFIRKCREYNQKMQNKEQDRKIKRDAEARVAGVTFKELSKGLQDIRNLT